MQLGALPLLDAWVPESSTFADAVETLFKAQAPALAVLDGEHRPVGMLTERDVLGAIFPRYLAELRHTSFLPDDDAGLEERASSARSMPIGTYARPVDPLDATESQTHAAEKLMHTGEQALPVVEDGRFVGMLSIAALCHARLDEAPET
jgi:CBS domain-containing protein